MPTKRNSISGADYAEILEQVGAAVITIDHSAVITHVNRAATAMFGFGPDQMTGENVSMLMPQFHALRHDHYIEHHLRTGEASIIGKGRRVEGLRQDGTVFPLHLSVGRHDQDGGTVFTGILHDLSQVEHARDQALRFGRIVDDSVNEIYVFSSLTLRFSLVNRGALENLGYALAEMKTMTPLDIKPEFSEKTFRALIEPLLAGNTDKIAFQSEHVRKDGSHYDADVKLVLSAAVQPPEVVAIIEDCTERNRMLEAVQQSQKMESIGQLTGGIAHDFNNLLTVISGNLELLEMGLQGKEDLELVNEAKSASSRGADLTARLLSFAMRSDLSPKRVNLNEIVVDLSELLVRTVGEQISLHTTLAQHVWIVKIDKSQIDSALMNLVLNARDAMPKGGSIFIETKNRIVSPSEADMLDMSAGNYVELKVTDSGSGIDQDNLKRVFEPFFTTKSKSGGHGLGLSMVYGFARQSGGYLGVLNAKGRGAEFSLLLPRDWPGESEALTTHASDAFRSRAARVLLVEDDDSVRRLTRRRLMTMGHTVLEACNGKEALSVFKANPDIDLLFTDMVMPGKLSGWDLAEHLLLEIPGLPVILSSGFSHQLQTIDVKLQKSLYSLRKPYTMEQLTSMMATALNSRSSA